MLFNQAGLILQPIIVYTLIKSTIRLFLLTLTHILTNLAILVYGLTKLPPYIVYKVPSWLYVSAYQLGLPILIDLIIRPNVRCSSQAILPIN